MAANNGYAQVDKSAAAPQPAYETVDPAPPQPAYETVDPSPTVYQFGDVDIDGLEASL